jgi:hypothetical protein
MCILAGMLWWWALFVIEIISKQNGQLACGTKKCGVLKWRAVQQLAFIPHVQ